MTNTQDEAHEDMLKTFRKEVFRAWIREQIDQWIDELGAWDDRLEDPDDDFDYDDWEWIRDNLKVVNIDIEEVG